VNDPRAFGRCCGNATCRRESVLVVEDLKLDCVEDRVERAGRGIELIEGVYAPEISDAECPGGKSRAP